MKALPKIDFKKVAMQTVGEAAGLFALGKLAEVEFVKKQSPLMKGLIYKAVGTIIVPMIAGKAKKGGEVIEGLGSVLNIAGTSNIVNSFNKKDAVKPLVPSIGGYETNPIAGPGYEFEEHDEEDGVSGPFDEEDDD